ncbi:hypothetical protein BKA67DRAFT_537444 [Truncatella angustata]|uniref:Uncharacterized protein n=1 Tax=Truncatella angustata TaxID=152316 RepID=A0A9P8UG88_9PEZI|nr:uncharacterized protein BKA67DRAFT_537444 [Truncatella angustata]KAH6651578.1 hypothetical protein BKA67DRAFT_537444 [Truncatella angustata]
MDTPVVGPFGYWGERDGLNEYPWPSWMPLDVLSIPPMLEKDGRLAALITQNIYQMVCPSLSWCHPYRVWRDCYQPAVIRAGVVADDDWARRHVEALGSRSIEVQICMYLVEKTIHRRPGNPKEARVILNLELWDK